MRGGATIVGAVALCAAGGRAGADPRPFTVGGELGGVALVGSHYRDSLSAFGLTGPVVGLQLAGRALWGVGDRVHMGFRVGYLLTSASPADDPTDPTAFPVSPAGVGFHIVDAGWAMRTVTWRSDPQPNRGLRFGFDFEAGGAAIFTTWLRGSATALVPRFGVAAVITYAGQSPAFFGVRLGAQYLPSGGASGGSYWDAAFAGVTLAVQFGGGR